MGTGLPDGDGWIRIPKTGSITISGKGHPSIYEGRVSNMAKQLRMVWKNKEPVPAPLPEGYRIVDSSTREYTLDQIAAYWSDNCTELNGGKVFTKNEFLETQWNAPKTAADSIFFVADPDGRLISTATAQIFDEHTGNLHMVGTSMDCKGKGAGRAVCTACVRYFQKHNLTLAHLLTDDFRIPAIKIYVGLGYRPYLYDVDMKDRWTALLPILGLKELEAYDENLDSVILTPAEA